MANNGTRRGDGGSSSGSVEVHRLDIHSSKYIPNYFTLSTPSDTHSLTVHYDSIHQLLHFKKNDAHSLVHDVQVLQQRLNGNEYVDWKLMVVIRDPAERLLSGFMDKCARNVSHWTDRGILKQWTRMYGEDCSSNFTVFAHNIMRKIKSGGDFNYHFKPQHEFCGLDWIYPKFVDDVLIYHKDTIGRDTLDYLRRHHVEDFYSEWGRHRNETLFDQPIRGISLRKDQHDDCQFYSRYYDVDLLERVQEAFKRDYQLFALPDPSWKRCLNGTESSRLDFLAVFGFRNWPFVERHL